MPKTIFLTFANNSDAPLNALKEEDKIVYGYVDQRRKGTEATIHRDSFCTTGSILEHLNDKKEQLLLFHYSGHANEKTLFLENEQAHREGLTSFLGLAPNLKLIILNGCETHGLASQLLGLPSKPAVIFTTAKVPDEVALRFSKTFYQALCQKNNSIQTAFTAADSAVKTVSDNGVVTPHRGMGNRSEKGMYVLSCEDQNLLLETFSDILEEAPIQFTVNSILTKELFETYEAYDENVRQLYESEDHNNLVTIQGEILKALPRPISEQLRKLFAIRLANASSEQHKENVFFDKLGFGRLKQMAYTCFTFLELIAFIHLSQLWDEVEQGNVVLTADEQSILLALFKEVSEEKQIISIFKLLQATNTIFNKHTINNFLEELKIDDLSSKKHFQDALTFFQEINQEILQKGSITENKAMVMCMEAEKMLAIIFSELAFIVAYQMESIQSIQVMSYRHLEDLEYNFARVALIQNLARVKRINVPRKKTSNTRSVFLTYKLKDKQPLNLTPFIIDENAFPARKKLDGKQKSNNATIAKICSFTNLKDYQFRHVYQPKEKIEIKERAELNRFKMIKEQVDSFAATIFNRK